MFCYCRYQVISGKGNLNMAHSVRCNIRTCTHIADSLDGIHNAFHLFFFYSKIIFLFLNRPGRSCQIITGVRQMLPQMFSNKRHERVKKCQHACQCMNKYILCNLSVLIVRPIETVLSQFNIPVTEIIPGEVINVISGCPQFKLIQVPAYIFNGTVEAVENPAVCQSKIRRVRNEGFLIIVQIHNGKLSGIPQLIGKVTVSFYLFIVETHIIAWCITGYQSEAQRIGAIFINNFQRINAIAKGLGHLTALRVANQTMDKYVSERHFMHKFHGHEHHTGYPEEDDVIAGYQSTGWIPSLKYRSLFRPAHGGKRPECRREPGIKNIRILMNVLAVAVRAFGQVRTGC